MPIAQKFKFLKNYRGKSNAVITIIIPPNIDLEKEIAFIVKTIFLIKNTEKRTRLVYLFEFVINHLKNDFVNSINGKIICSGVNYSNGMEYFELDPPNKIEKFEYYCDFLFNIDRIREIWYKDVFVYPTEEEKNILINNLKKDIRRKDPKILLTEGCIQGALIRGIFKEMYYFSDKELSDDKILLIKGSCGKIIKINDESMRQQYGDEIGVTWFIDIDLSNNDYDNFDDIEELTDIDN